VSSSRSALPEPVVVGRSPSLESGPPQATKAVWEVQNGITLGFEIPSRLRGRFFVFGFQRSFPRGA
jgi:hypothetical protein